MADDVFDYFDRKFAEIERQHRKALETMNVSVASSTAQVRQAAVQATAEIPARIDDAFAQGLAEMNKANAYSASALRELEQTADRLRLITRQRLFDHLSVVAVSIVGIVLAGMIAGQIYRWAKDPVIERQNWGCTAAWDAQAQRCRGDWVRLRDS